jgi:hypothetical protein
MTVAMAMSRTMAFDVHLTNVNGFVIDSTITMFVIVMAMTLTIVIVRVIVSVLLLVTINNMISNTNHGNDIITIAMIMIMASIMYTTIALIINDTTSSNINLIIKQ